VLQAQSLTLHQVLCSKTGIHIHHHSNRFYLDCPKLFAGDSKANSLRGKKEVSNFFQYLESHPEIIFVVFKQYSCDTYYDGLRIGFEPIVVPKFPSNLLAQLKTYFFRLETDGEVASKTTEFIRIVSKDLATVLDELAPTDGGNRALASKETGFDFDGSLLSSTFLDAESYPHLRPPYTRFYNLRHSMPDILAETKISSTSRENLALLFECIRHMCSTDWTTADMMFGEGQISKKHLSKLFDSGDILVQKNKGQPIAYQLQSFGVDHSDSSIKLHCISWSYDEVFKQESRTHTIQWPSKTDTLAITELDIFPLRYDRSGLEERLRVRGRQFWECRKRAFVGYESPNPRFEMQSVSRIKIQ